LFFMKFIFFFFFFSRDEYNYLFFFFFQAEDGIRDRDVTGVQTCALPICGCGVPDAFIAYIGSMVGWPIEYYSCFISYSTRDQKFAARLHADLQAKGVRCWFAPHDMHGGRNIHEQIDEAIRLHDRLLLILSEDSMKSDWVR